MNPSEILRSGEGIIRGGARMAEWAGRQIASQTYGAIRSARGQSPKPGMDDATLAHKIESEIFRGTRISKATVNVNVVDGVVWLRGELKRPEQIRLLEERARAVPEVREVENLLHLPKTPAPTRADTPKRQQRTRSSTRRPTPRRTHGRVSDDRTDAIAREGEPAPVERARRRQGRTPAPLGSTGEGSGSGGRTSRAGATRARRTGPNGAAGTPVTDPERQLPPGSGGSTG